MLCLVNDYIHRHPTNATQVADRKVLAASVMETAPLPTNEDMDNMLSKRIEAYSSFEVMSSLLFGFAISVLFGGVFDESIWEDYNILQLLFVIAMGFVLISSAFSTIVVSISHFFVARYMADQKYIIAKLYVDTFRRVRYYARLSLYSGIIALIGALGVFVYPQLNIESAIAMLIILGSGAIVLGIVLYVMLNPQKFLNLEHLSQAERETLFANEEEESQGVQRMIIASAPSDLYIDVLYFV